jgi:hypothetical protein
LPGIGRKEGRGRGWGILLYIGRPQVAYGDFPIVVAAGYSVLSSPNYNRGFSTCPMLF